MFVSYIISQVDEELVANLQQRVTEMFIKSTVQCKVKLPVIYVNTMSAFLRHITHKEFKDDYLPAMQKAMLRSPEVCLENIAAIVKGLKIDLSACASDLASPFCTSARSKDDATRDAAVKALEALALQCSDPESLKIVLKSIFAVLNGEQGKLTVNTHKISLLQAAGASSKNAVTGNSVQDCANLAITEFAKILESEVHEGTMLSALESCSLWMAKLTGGVTTRFLDFFPKGMSAKAATSNVRAGYLTCLGSALEISGNLNSALKLIPVLMKTIENSSKQSGQVTIVSEGALAARCLVKLSALHAETENDVSSFVKK